MDLTRAFQSIFFVVSVKTAVLVMTAVMAPMTAVPGTVAGVTLSTVVAAGVAVMSAEASEGSHYDHQQGFSDSLISPLGDGFLCL